MGQRPPTLHRKLTGQCPGPAPFLASVHGGLCLCLRTLVRACVCACRGVCMCARLCVCVVSWWWWWCVCVGGGGEEREEKKLPACLPTCLPACPDPPPARWLVAALCMAAGPTPGRTTLMPSSYCGRRRLTAGYPFTKTSRLRWISRPVRRWPSPQPPSPAAAEARQQQQLLGHGRGSGLRPLAWA